MEEYEHTIPDSPDISCKAGVSFASSKLMFRSSKPWSSCWKIGNIIILFIPNCCKVNYLDLVSQVRALPTEDIVHFDIAIADSMLVHVSYSFADL